ncbi:MAG TPA: penicillin-binding transpeptidase domain-containing protein [Bryobacteraceae bacterium]|nr:penicillin-binding transpeptidase domain-containing protein [Bryobacteraceae bacterium]
MSLVLACGLDAASASPPVRKSTRRTSARKRRPAPPPVDPTLGDNIDGEDLVVRRAAVDALGPVKGSVVVVDPDTGRILTIVNQKLAFEGGYIPCSTIKLVTSLAALTEHVVDPDTWIYTGRAVRYNLTTALAVSNNQYFATLGSRLGFDRVVKYAQLLGLGEKAGLNIAEEQPGTIAEAPPAAGGMGMMTAYGEGFSVTPLELAALVSAIANGGTLYYLQYPRSEAEVENFMPQVKRQLDSEISGIADIRMGMRGAVDYGTARRAAASDDDPIYGKTGTCTDFRASEHMGWFGSFNEVGTHKLVVVVMLAGGHETSGAVAAGVAGAIYRSLAQQSYFVAEKRPTDFPELGRVSATAESH